MDSIFSLFDPSDGAPPKHGSNKRPKPDQETVKKASDPPSKGRRRGRKNVGKNETLPEESSFLCEPGLSTEILVKGGSYIESYIEVNKQDEDAEKRPKRRNSGRKTRRKKNKISPAKDLLPGNAWTDNVQVGTNWNNHTSNTNVCDEKHSNLNNQASISNICNETVGKNVNDLTSFNKVKRKNSTDKAGTFTERAVNNVIEKLEKVGLKDDTYLAGDFNTDDLDDDVMYSSDDLEESFDDSDSSRSEAGGAAPGSLPPEPRFGNVEYKLQLVAPCERRFQHLVTQLKWRLISGGGSAVYVIGVRDCGALRGLPARALRASLRTLRRMAAALGASLAHVTARRVAPQRAVAEVYVKKLADSQQSVELRVAVMGANEAGKSTLVGVLTQGELDNGRGSARLNMFRHLHEVKSGRTSSLSHEILGFDAQGNVINYGCSELMTAERIGERSAKLVSFLDLAGHSKYQRTTVHGLSGYSPHYAMLVISATAGITRITEEHIGLLLALDLPFFAVISKCELAPAALRPLLARLGSLLAPATKEPLLITDENLARNCVAPPQLILDAIDRGPDWLAKGEQTAERVPVFPVSCVRGAGLAALHAYLLALQPPEAPAPASGEDICEFQIDEIFHVGDSSGPVVGGLLARGRLREGDRVLIGPLESGEFAGIAVKTIYRNRVPHGSVRAGQSASLGLGPAPAALRPGMVLLSVSGTAPRAAPRCGAPCRAQQISQLLQNSKNRKNVRRKDKNFLQHLASVELSLTKVDNIESSNIYAGGDGEQWGAAEGGGAAPIQDKGVLPDDKGAMDAVRGEVCVCCDEAMSEDPSNPRGCMFFQATVRVLRHPTAICAGFQCTVHVGNVRQTAIIEGILSAQGLLRAGEGASALFRFARCAEYLVRGRRLLLTAGGGTRAIGRVTQVFPYVP